MVKTPPVKKQRLSDYIKKQDIYKFKIKEWKNYGIVNISQKKARVATLFNIK